MAEKLRSVRILVAGTRKFKNKAIFAERLDNLLSRLLPEDVELICGKTKRGTDAMTLEYAAINGYPVKQFALDIDSHGPKAMEARSTYQLGYATHLIAYFDGVNPDIQWIIDEARQRKIKSRIILVDESVD
jgi:hypothetical protein